MECKSKNIRGQIAYEKSFISTMWNVNSQTGGKVIFSGTFYLNYVECKLGKYRLYELLSKFYLNYVECKSNVFTLFRSITLLFYLNYVECKCLRASLT